MIDLRKVIKGLECRKNSNCKDCLFKSRIDCPYFYVEDCRKAVFDDAISILKEQKDLKQKMWNALYAEEDKLEKKFVGTEEHNDWFAVYRPWLQRGFEIAIKVIAEQDGM